MSITNGLIIFLGVVIYGFVRIIEGSINNRAAEIKFRIDQMEAKLSQMIDPK